MTSAFSTNDTECLSRDTEHQIDIENIDEIWNEQRLNECVKWINTYQYDKVSNLFSFEILLKLKYI